MSDKCNHSRCNCPTNADITTGPVKIDARHERQPIYIPRVKSPGVTIIRETPKIGRNEPCACGSGKKAKKCCLK